MSQIDLRSIKIQNMMSVFNTIYTKGAVSRNDISAETALSLMTVGKIVDTFLERGVAVETKVQSAKVGRKACAVSLDTHKKQIFILDLTTRNFLLNALNLCCESTDKGIAWEYDSGRSYEENLRSALAEFRQAVDTSAGSSGDVLGIGVIVPGPYLYQEDQVHSIRIAELTPIRLRALLEDMFGDTPVFIDEDVKYAVRYHTKAVDPNAEKSVFYGYIGEGVGGAAMTNGVLVMGKNCVAGDFGQMRMGGASLEEQISSIHIKHLDSAEAIADYIKGTIPILAEALYNVCWMFNPHVVILEKEYIHLLPGYNEQVQQALRTMLPVENMPEILAQNSLQQSSYQGAAIVVIERWISDLI